MKVTVRKKTDGLSTLKSTGEKAYFENIKDKVKIGLPIREKHPKSKTTDKIVSQDIRTLELTTIAPVPWSEVN